MVETRCTARGQKISADKYRSTHNLNFQWNFPKKRKLDTFTRACLHRRHASPTRTPRAILRAVRIACRIRLLLWQNSRHELSNQTLIKPFLSVSAVIGSMTEVISASLSLLAVSLATGLLLSVVEVGCSIAHVLWKWFFWNNLADTWIFSQGVSKSSFNFITN